VLIELDSRAAVFFRQVRMGCGDRTLRICKLRTMTADADDWKSEVAPLDKHLRHGDDPRMFKIDDDPRVTRVGGLRRRYAIDELPQLFNVVGGEMSLVAPRPLSLEEDSYVAEWARRRLDLRPGITGTWQVSGRTEIPFGEMVRLDYLYATGWSLWNDIRLILRTLPTVRGGVE
jgi:lipopolysaccharide/colanic/teichoic acid biosynthesis glycosyltransferase